MYTPVFLRKSFVPNTLVRFDGIDDGVIDMNWEKEIMLKIG